MAATDRRVIWLAGEIKTPPFSAAVRLEAGWLQGGELLALPHSRPVPAVGKQ